MRQHWWTLGDKCNMLHHHVTYFLKLTTAERSSPCPTIWMPVTFPCFLYSWKRPSRKLVSVKKCKDLVLIFLESLTFSNTCMYSLSSNIFTSEIWKLTLEFLKEQIFLLTLLDHHSPLERKGNLRIQIPRERFSEPDSWVSLEAQVLSTPPSTLSERSDLTWTLDGGFDCGARGLLWLLLLQPQQHRVR